LISWTSDFEVHILGKQLLGKQNLNLKKSLLTIFHTKGEVAGWKEKAGELWRSRF